MAHARGSTVPGLASEPPPRDPFMQVQGGSIAAIVVTIETAAAAEPVKGQVLGCSEEAEGAGFASRGGAHNALRESSEGSGRRFTGLPRPSWP